MKRTPHREPIVAALARRDQLTSRIGEVDPHAVPRIAVPPASFAAALSENARLEQVLSSLTLTRSEPHDDEASDELRPVVDDHDAPLLGDVPVDREGADRDHRRRIGVTLGVFGPVALLALALCFALQPAPPSTARPRRDSVTVRLGGVVISRAGKIDLHDGERCDILVADSGEREAGRMCTSTLTANV